MNELPHSWVVSSIAEVTTPFMSVDPTKTPDRAFRYVDIGSIDNETQTITDPKSFIGRDAPSRARRLIRTGDTLFSTVRTYLKNIAMVPDELNGELTSTGIAVLRPNDAVDAGYLFRWACSDDFVGKLSSAQDGTMYPAVSDRDVAAASIPLPPLPEQRRIVAKIESLTGKSRRARDHLDHIPRLVEKYKQAVLTTALMGGLTREWRAKRGVVAAWETTSPAEHFQWSSGKNLPAKKQAGGTVPVIGGNGIGGYHNETLISFPTLVIGRVGAQCGNVHFSSGPAWITDNAIYARSISDRIDLAFAIIFFRNANLNQLAGGSGQPYVNQSTLNELVLDLPTLDEQREIVRRVEHMMAWIDKLASEGTSARKLIDNLDRAVLARAFRGELAPQDPDDEPASVLLKRIRAERGVAQRAKRGRTGR